MAKEQRLIAENDIYDLFEENGTARLHVGHIDVLPRVASVEVVHAYWTGSRFNPMTDEYEEFCSHCCAWSSEYGKPYCPNCGAKMDGDRRTDG